jgi:hypothetical protein
MSISSISFALSAIKNATWKHIQADTEMILKWQILVHTNQSMSAEEIGRCSVINPSSLFLTISTLNYLKTESNVTISPKWKKELSP